MQSDRIKNWPADERPREKLLAHGAEHLSPAELLAVVLRVGQGTFQKGVLGQNATAFAKQMIDEAKGAADEMGRRIEAEMEAYLLGTKKVPAS